MCRGSTRRQARISAPGGRSCASRSRPPPRSSCRGLDLPPVIGHRGAAGVRRTPWPGFARRGGLAVPGSNSTCASPPNGVPVVCHDSRLRRTTDGHGLISRLPAAMVRAYDAGRHFDPGFADERVPTLDEVLRLADELELGVNVEIKADRGFAAADPRRLSPIPQTLRRAAPWRSRVELYRRGAGRVPPADARDRDRAPARPPPRPLARSPGGSAARRSTSPSIDLPRPGSRGFPRRRLPGARLYG